MNVISSTPWAQPEPATSLVHLDMVPEGVLHSLAAGSPESVPSRYVSPYIAGLDGRRIWSVRSAQVKSRPLDAPWITRLIIDPELETPVGMAGFHGPPDSAGMVEIGYQVDPELRRLGYASRAVETMLAVARHHPDVHVVRATISPENVASLALIAGYGFVETGEQWDDEDGLEIIFELSVSAPLS